MGNTRMMIALCSTGMGNHSVSFTALLCLTRVCYQLLFLWIARRKYLITACGWATYLGIQATIPVHLNTWRWLYSLIYGRLYLMINGGDADRLAWVSAAANPERPVQSIGVKYYNKQIANTVLTFMASTSFLLPNIKWEFSHISWIWLR